MRNFVNYNFQKKNPATQKKLYPCSSLFLYKTPTWQWRRRRLHYCPVLINCFTDVLFPLFYQFDDFLEFPLLLQYATLLPAFSQIFIHPLRIFSGILLTFSILCGNITFAQNNSFRDVRNTSAYTEAIEYVASEGIMQGTQGGRFFQPKQQVNRAEFLEIISNIEASAEEKEDCLQEYQRKQYHYVAFPDVSVQEWYAPAVCIGYKYNLVSGYSDGSFRPHQTVSVSEAAKILTQIFQLQEGVERDTWYLPYITALENHAALPLTLTHANAPLRRDELAEMIYRLEENITNLPSLSVPDIDPPVQSPCGYDVPCLVIPRLNITVPVVFGIGVGAWQQQDWDQLEWEMMKALENGVVHDPGTAKPGKEGNVFISGHSSYYSNLPGRYKDVFAPLEELNTGDTFEIYYEQQKIVYRVFEEKIVLPTESSVLDQPAGVEYATLMTCWPRYTNWKRLILVAERIQ